LPRWIEGDRNVEAENIVVWHGEVFVRISPTCIVRLSSVAPWRVPRLFLL
jgi:hypothetical protein